MNWLAHVFLSEHKIDFQIGNFLADPLKGRIWEDASKDMINGMITHKIIDSYTDSHELVRISKNRLGNKGLLKSVVIDLTYDYLLTKNWNNFCNISLNDFSNTFYKKALIRNSSLPSHTNLYVENMIEKDLLNKYHSIDDLSESFKRMDNRLSSRLKKRDTTSRYINIVKENIKEIEKDFLEYFPLLCKKVKSNLDSTKIKHWKH